MIDAYLFSNFCPHFSVFELEKYLKRFSSQMISEENLLEISSFRAYNWFVKNKDRWKKHRDISLKSLTENKNVLKWNDEGYPENLKTLSFPPALLYTKGSLNIKEPRVTVAIVGARQPTHTGRLWVQKVVPELVKLGIVIVSGGARGIDAEAHWSALEAGGETIAFLPGCVQNAYPSSNKIIFDRIEKSGVLISEYPRQTLVRSENFHRRNRLIAGLADLTIIVEAGGESGTLMTANKALSENRDILVVPGSPLIDSYKGSLELIATGAGVARDENDIIFSLVRKNVLNLTKETPRLGT